MCPWHLPNHNYLGPGTVDFTKKPVDLDDEIASVHDRDYNFSLVEDDIRIADKKAVKSFWKDFTSTGNFHSLLGAAGLGSKYAVEGIFNHVFYPSMPKTPLSRQQKLYRLRQVALARYARENNLTHADIERNQREILENYPWYNQALNRYNTETLPPSSVSGFQTARQLLGEQQQQQSQRPIPLATSTPNRGPGTQQVLDDSQDDIFNQINMDDQQQGEEGGAAGDRVERDVGNMNAGSIAGGGSGGNKSKNRFQILHTPSISNETFSIKHCHCFQTWGYKFSYFKNTSTPTKQSYLLHYPLAVLPVDLLSFYMSPIEFQNLPTGSYVKEVFVKVTPIGERISFDTGTTLSGSANNQQVILGITAVGLNHKYLIRHRKIKNNSSSPMSPSYEAITGDHIKQFIHTLWGDTQDSDSFFTNFPTSLWAIRSLPMYAGFFIPAESEQKNKSFHLKSGTIDLTRHTNVFNFVDHKGVPCVNYKYKPKFAPIKVRRNIVGTDGTVGSDHEYLGNPLSLYDIRIKVDGGKISSSPQTSISWEHDNDYYVPLEQSNYKTTLNNQFNCNSQPQLHIGLLSCQANSPTDASPSFVNACGIYYVETEIHISTNIQSMFNHSDVISQMKSIYDRSYDMPGLYNVEHYAGSLSCKPL